MISGLVSLMRYFTVVSLLFSHVDGRCMIRCQHLRGCLDHVLVDVCRVFHFLLDHCLVDHIGFRIHFLVDLMVEIVALIIISSWQS